MGSSSFIYKQRYLPRNDTRTRGLNQRHLVYIATRPGVMKNPDSGFGLWGKVSGMAKISNVDDLRSAVKTVGAASEKHTVYRAVLSVNKNTAQKYNLYEREEWERLLRSRISVLRQEMHIKDTDFCWYAAMHYKKHHPHVHIVYWDNSDQPKAEYINAERFEQLSENVRQAFTAALENQSEINATLNESKALTAQAREQLSVMLVEANVADALNLDHVPEQQSRELGDELIQLAIHLPVSGSLKYDFLPAAYKQRLDQYIDHVLQISDFDRLLTQYLNLRNDVGKLYGNTPERLAENRDKARRDFVKAMGNETMKYLKEVAQQLRSEVPKDLQTLVANCRTKADAILNGSAEYAELLAAMPPHRTSFAVLLRDEKFAGQFNALTASLTRDIRISAEISAFANGAKDAKKEAGAEVSAAIRQLLKEKLEEDKDYIRQRNADIAVMGLLRLFRETSRYKNQQQAIRGAERTRYNNLGAEAKRDLRKQRQQESSWTPEM